MGLFKNQFSNLVEWNENGEGVLFYKFQNQEIKKGSRLIIRPGQDAIFLYNGRVEGIFTDDGDYDIESEIIPFLTTLKSFKFGFNTPLRAEVLFINTKELLVKWGTKNAINLQAPGLPGGMPVRAFGTFNCRIVEHDVVIEKLAGIRQTYTVEDVKERIVASLDQLLMSWISKEGRDMFNLQSDARNIAKGIESDLDMDMRKLGIGISDFTIESFSYPEEIKKMQEKAAAQSMMGDMDKYTRMDQLNPNGNGQSGQQQVGQAAGAQQNAAQGGAGPKFCPNCGTPATGSKFCGNCGNQLY